MGVFEGINRALGDRRAISGEGKECFRGIKGRFGGSLRHFRRSKGSKGSKGAL